MLNNTVLHAHRVVALSVSPPSLLLPGPGEASLLPQRAMLFLQPYGAGGEDIIHTAKLNGFTFPRCGGDKVMEGCDEATGYVGRLVRLEDKPVLEAREWLAAHFAAARFFVMPWNFFSIAARYYMPNVLPSPFLTSSPLAPHPVPIFFSHPPPSSPPPPPLPLPLPHHQHHHTAGSSVPGDDLA